MRTMSANGKKSEMCCTRMHTVVGYSEQFQRKFHRDRKNWKPEKELEPFK